VKTVNFITFSDYTLYEHKMNKMKIRSLIGMHIIWLLLPAMVKAQPAIQWQKTLGGNSYEFGYAAQHTADGGYILAALSYSTNSGDVSGGDNNGDYWIVKLDLNGEVQWQTALGGSMTEAPFSIKQTSDNGFIAAGVTNSNDGDVFGNHGGELDCWVVKLSHSGAIEWQKTLGGSKRDEARCIQPTSDGGYILTGFSNSNDGDVTSNLGGSDVWVVKLTATGSIQWQKSVGGSKGDFGYSIVQTTDGGYILVGQTGSNDGDVTGSNGDNDYWVVKLDGSGSIIWQKTLGGAGIDSAQAVCQTPDGGYIVIGYAGSGVTGDISDAFGGFDVWMVKLSPNGGIKWQKTLGGSDNDWGMSIDNTLDGGYIFGGSTLSMDVDVTSNDGGLDFWIVKTDILGNIQWEKTLGGTKSEFAHSVQQTADNGFFVAGITESNDLDISLNHGNNDFWIVKLSPEAISPVLERPLQPLSFAPNPAQNTLVYTLPNNETIKIVEIFDLTGKAVLTQLSPENNQVNIQPLPTGHYNIAVTTVAGIRFAGVFQKL
jgi:hypothetical protein